MLKIEFIKNPEWESPKLVQICVGVYKSGDKKVVVAVDDSAEGKKQLTDVILQLDQCTLSRCVICSSEEYDYVLRYVSDAFYESEGLVILDVIIAEALDAWRAYKANICSGKCNATPSDCLPTLEEEDIAVPVDAEEEHLMPIGTLPTEADSEDTDVIDCVMKALAGKRKKVTLSGRAVRT